MNELMTSIMSHVPSWLEFKTAIPVILSLIMIEGLLSVDNALGIAAMAKELPPHQQKLALRLGIIGAYLFRGICMLFVAFIAANMWLKMLGAVYLIYLMCKHLVTNEEEQAISVKTQVTKGFLATIVSIEVMDLSLSLDNVVAAVALDKRLWVVCTGVFIGILALRFVAGYCIVLIEKFPILQKTAFLLVGFVGMILLTEITLEYAHIHFHINSIQKFIGIIGITAATLLYGHTKVGQKILHPVVKGGMPLLRMLNTVLGWTMMPFVMIIQGIRWMFSDKKTLPAEAR